ncbi:MAG: DNA phosphorothioation-associated putative methyltransferase [Acidobacteriota bacterium]|nr:DNA phosphorothioation-associated putative methyltransferase [Acidobacteriota bacterium]
MISTIAEVKHLCRSSPVGKLLPDALYIHISALSHLHTALQTLERQARRYIQNPEIEKATVIKFHLNQAKISYLFYPEFDVNAHPTLERSIQVNWATGQVVYKDYSSSHNPPVLHRKEMLVTPEYPFYEIFAQLSRQEEEAGLLNETHLIGTLNNWKLKLQNLGIKIEGHRLICRSQSSKEFKEISHSVQRHRSAIVRSSLSKPVRCAIEAGLLTKDTTFFDYGCGHGLDYQILQKQGFTSMGWDPYYFPSNPIQPADIVNLGYVINVIEDPDERRETLIRAWSITRKALIVAAQVLIDDINHGQIAYGDGVITSRNTFQKYYEQEELKNYIDQVLGVDSIPVALGIYFVFRDEYQAQNFRVSYFHTRTSQPRISRYIQQFADYESVLTPLINFVTEHGRMPNPGELESESEIITAFGSIRRAFQVVLKATNQDDWKKIIERRRQDLLLYIALTRFGRRPKFRELPLQLQWDIKALLGSYQEACREADAMLYSLRDLRIVQEKCQNSTVGKKGLKSLTVHISTLEHLDILLRLYEACASRTIGRPKEATLIKFHTDQPKISYFFVPNFDHDPHPIIQARMEINLKNLRVYYQEFSASDNPPVIHRKDALVLPSYPHYGKFAKLTQQEEDWGLLDDEASIRHLEGWQACLKRHFAKLQGHRIVWQKDCNPYLMRILRSQINSRRRKRLQESKVEVS